MAQRGQRPQPKDGIGGNRRSRERKMSSMVDVSIPGYYLSDLLLVSLKHGDTETESELWINGSNDAVLHLRVSVVKIFPLLASMSS